MLIQAGYVILAIQIHYYKHVLLAQAKHSVLNVILVIT